MWRRRNGEYIERRRDDEQTCATEGKEVLRPMDSVRPQVTATQDLSLTESIDSREGVTEEKEWCGEYQVSE